MENRVILAFPRSGSKLLASVHQQNGYHNFGEFFNSYSTVILDHPVLRAVRMPIDQQRQIWKTRKDRGADLDNWTQNLIVKHRVKKFNQHKNLTPSIVSIWFASIKSTPDAFNLMNERTVLCLRRKNKFDQILSRCITHSYLNHDNEFPSRPMNIDVEYFNLTFDALVKLEQLQDYYIAAGNGKIIDFDELIAGTADLGFSYNVTSTDQHPNLESLVLNLETIKARYQELVTLYNIQDETN